jgi:NAD(P)-dependent dehydrogenase (short-subunit alcohol dehydrogenase family)
MRGLLAGKVAIVTGAGRGIGAAVARCFCAEGARVVLADIDELRSQAVCDEITRQGGAASACQVDITSIERVQEMIASTEALFGNVEILVNNAGVTAQAHFLDTTRATFDALINTNIAGTFFCSQEAARSMRKAGQGSIINVSSHSGLLGSSNRTAYAASKGGIISLTRAMAVDLAAYNIRVNGIAPGAIEVQRAHKPAHDAARRKAWTAAIPMERYGSPEEIASVALFLASQHSSYVTGHTIPVDGGFTAAGLRVQSAEAATEA